MAKQLVSDELWDVIEPLLSPEPPKPKGGRPRVPDRNCLTGIIFVLRSGIPWEMLPQVAWALEHLGWIETERPRELRDQATRQKDGFWPRLALFGTVAMTYRGNPSAFSALSA